MKVRPGTPADTDRAFGIWQAAVDATHGFLSPEHRAELTAIVRDMLQQYRPWIAEGQGRAQGFMVFKDGWIEALFVDPDVHGQGYGTALVARALELAPHPLVDANEQADNALQFYEARGFVRIGRSETDSDGRPYPIVHLRHVGSTGP